MNLIKQFNLLDFVMLKSGVHLVVGERASDKAELVKVLTSFSGIKIM